MGRILQSFDFAPLLAKALGFPLEFNTEIVITIRAGEPVVIDIKNFGDKRLEEFDWTTLQGGEIHVTNQVYDLKKAEPVDGQK